MYDGKQVLRIANSYKSKDLYNIGNEMNKRQGTGNYDKDRTKFNIHYKDINSYNLYQEVKQKLEDNNIEYLHKTKTNMLNGITITSGQEFFQTLGMNFKETGRYHQSGENKGQPIMCPNIKCYDDIPEEITEYFDYCYEFIKNKFGEENIVMAQVHYDEDTPHLQAYFLPVVKEVKRKSYEKDFEGNVIKETIKGKDGKEKLVPKLKRDSEGKIIYDIVKGNFLNNDQYWKDRGGKESFTKLQNEFNDYITSKGYRLDRGNIGSNKVHQDKLDYQISESKAELGNLKEYISNSKEELKEVTNSLKNHLKPLNNKEINIKKTLNVYNKKDVENLIDYATNLKRLNNLQTYTIKDKDSKNFSLQMENDYYKNNKQLIKAMEDNHYKDKYIKEQKYDYSRLEDAVHEIGKALTSTLHILPKSSINAYVKLAQEVNAVNRLNSKDKEAQDEFSKLFNHNNDNGMEL